MTQEEYKSEMLYLVNEIQRASAGYGDEGLDITEQCKIAEAWAKEYGHLDEDFTKDLLEAVLSIYGHYNDAVRLQMQSDVAIAMAKNKAKEFAQKHKIYD